MDEGKLLGQKSKTSVKKRAMVFFIAMVLMLGLLPASGFNAFAATTLTSHVKIEMAETSSVSAGTIRYVNQSQTYGAQYFYSSYWGSNTSVAGIQCNLASISMGLSYIGANKLPAAMTAFSGVSSAISGSGESISNPSSISAGIDRMQNGNGKYSPVIIHMSAYHTSGSTYEHWVVVADRVSGDTYYIVDPAYGIGASAYYTAQIRGNTLTAWGKNSTIDDYYQFYNPNGSISSTPSNASVSTDKPAYTIGETVTITPSATGADHFTMRICYGTYGGDTTVYSDFDGFVGSKTYTPTKTGTYIVRVSAVGSSGVFIDAECTFKVVAAPSNAAVTTNKTLYRLGETVTITPSGNNIDHYTMRIWLGEVGGNGTVVYSDFDGFTGAKSFTPTITGKYIVRVSAINQGGTFIDAECSFTVTDVPTNASVSTDKSSYALGEIVTITPYADGVNRFTIRICYGVYGSDTTVYSDFEGFLGSKTFSPTEAGTYIVRVSAVSASGEFADAQCSFEVEDPSATISGLSMPDSIDIGTTPVLEGTVTANFDFTWVWVGVDKKGQNGHLTQAQANPMSSNYDISGLLNQLEFSILSAGEYTLKVEATGCGKYWILFAKDFTVTDEPVTSTVSFNPQLGIVSPTSKTVTRGNAYGELPTPTRELYAFDGWFTAAVDGELITEKTIVTASSDHVLYAHWSYICENGHDYQEQVTEPSCTEGGYTTHTCSRCGGSYVAEETAALGHDWGEWCPVPINFCTDPRIEDRTCNRCGATESHTLSPGGHTPGEPVKENAIAPTCEAAGGYDMVVYCSACGAETSREHTDTPALGHNWNEPEYVWADDYGIVTATRTCKNDANHKETETVNTTSEVTKPATYDAEGEITYTAVFENEAFTTQTKTVAIPKLEKPDDPTPSLPCNGGDDCPGKIFMDMPAKGNWAHDAIDWAIVNKITAGTSATTFSPNTGCTRAQVVTFLWRAAGEPEPETTNNPFEDVKERSWYYKAVLWAAETDVTAGTSATTFSPDATCTRAQIVTFLWRFEGEPASTTTNNSFTDVKAGAYYEKAVLWASETGVTAGTSATTFSPSATCTRAQIVTFLYRDLAA